jgi:myosin-5
VFQAPNERNFGIFYQLLAGSTDEEKERWELHSTDFLYLNQGKPASIDGVDDEEDFNKVKVKLTLLANL